MSRPLVLDAMGMIHRGYHAAGEDGARDYIARTLDRLCDELRPSRVVAAMDREPLHRLAVLPVYKSNRGARPPAILNLAEWFATDCDANGIVRFYCEGHEADDVIATLAARHDCDVVSADKDMLQVVRDGVDVLSQEPRGVTFRRFDLELVEDVWGVRPGLIRDVLGLAGDAVDCVPGVRGVGEKTAVRLVREYGGLERVYEALESVAPTGLRERLRAGRDLAFLSRDVVTLRADLPLGGIA